MKINDMVEGFEIYTSNEEKEFLDRITQPVKMSTLTERDYVVAENLIRKSLLIKVGFQDPSIVKNER